MKKILILFLLLDSIPVFAGIYEPGPGKYILSLPNQFTAYQINDQDLKWKNKMVALKIQKKEVGVDGGTIKVFLLTQSTCGYIDKKGKRFELPVYINSADPKELVVTAKDDHFNINLKNREVWEAWGGIYLEHNKGKILLYLTGNKKF